MMHRVVFDTNVLVSSLITRGRARELWEKARRGEFTLISSSLIVSEFVDVMSRDKFTRYADETDLRIFLEALHETAKFVRIQSKFHAVKQDPEDDVMLQTARDGAADYVVSGDGHLLQLGEFRGIRILSVDEMLKLLDS